MATHSSILAWRIPWSEEPGGLQSSSIHLFSHVWLFATHGLKPAKLICPWNCLGKNTRVACHFLLQGIFQTQGLKPHLLNLLQWQADPLPLAIPGKPKSGQWDLLPWPGVRPEPLALGAQSLNHQITREVPLLCDFTVLFFFFSYASHHPCSY